MRTRLVLAAAALLLIGVGSATSAPIKGATYYGYTAEADFVSFLSTPQCPGFAGLYVTPTTGRQDMHAVIKGWHGPPYFEDGALMPISEPVRANAHFYGSITDVAGHTYSVNGNFSDDSTHSMLLDGLSSTSYFQGTGSVVLTGPSGTLQGDARFNYVGNYPVSFDVTFTDVHACHMN